MEAVSIPRHSHEDGFTGKPKPETLTYKSGDGLHTREWIYYQFSSEFANYDLAGYWFQSLRYATLDEQEYYARQFIQEGFSLSSLDLKFKTPTLKNIEGRTGLARFKYEGDPIGVRCFVWNQGKAAFVVYCYFNQSLGSKANAELDRIISSIQMD